MNDWLLHNLSLLLVRFAVFICQLDNIYQNTPPPHNDTETTMYRLGFSRDGYNKGISVHFKRAMERTKANNPPPLSLSLSLSLSSLFHNQVLCVNAKLWSQSENETAV